jgi:hypothetical protein
MFLRKIAAPSGGYSVSKSLRFRSSASAYLSRTPSVTGNRQTWTWSGWVKRGALTSTGQIFGSNYSAGGFGAAFGNYGGSGVSPEVIGVTLYGVGTVTSTPVYRDPSAWYHIVLRFDSTQATQANRFILYVNGVQQTLSSALNVTQNANYNVNLSGAAHSMFGDTGGYDIDGYLAEVNFVDGQYLAPTSFGAYDTNGVWQPKAYTGTYGTNGFYLTFGNTTSTATLGNDSSGNSNTWTVNNISLTAGSTYDSMTDSPTVTSASVANYATMNPLDTGSTITLSEANLKTTSTATNNTSRGTIGVTSGKWYWEVQVVSGGNYVIGVATGTFTNATSAFTAYAGGYGYVDNGNKQNNGTSVAYGGTMSAGDIIGVAFDASAGSLTFYKNNTSQGVAYTGLTNGPYFPAGSCQSSVMVFNFGQRPFTYTPPTGFNALNTYNLPTPAIANGAQYMAATTYTGDGAASKVINNGTNNTISTTFQPDLVWFKDRTTGPSNHGWVDVVRGVTGQLSSSLTNAEVTGTNGITSLNSNGFTIGAATTSYSINANGDAYVAWQWKAGNSSGSSNTNGSITSTVSANTTAGFSVVTYTGNATAGATVGHGLGVAPNMIIFKRRSATENWNTYHVSLGNNNLVALNLASAASATSDFFNTTPTSSVFYIGSGTGNNGSGSTYVAYCFAAIAGYSAFGSYTGNGSSDGPFVYTGFRPRYLLIKLTTGANSWRVVDSSRNPYNLVNLSLRPDASDAEYTNVDNCDFLSNGFKLRGTDGGNNGSGQTFIYAAYAENPFNSSRAR